MLQKKLDLGYIDAGNMALEAAGDDWGAAAYQVFLEILRDLGVAATWQIREIAERDYGFPAPPTGNKRAWGPIATKARRAGFARRAGTSFSASSTSHASNHGVWEWIGHA